MMAELHMKIKKTEKTLHLKKIETKEPLLDPRAIPPGVAQEDALFIEAIVIENIHPELDQGRFAAKAVVGELFRIEADIFKDGHDKLGAVIMRPQVGGSHKDAGRRLGITTRSCGRVTCNTSGASPTSVTLSAVLIPRQPGGTYER